MSARELVVLGTASQVPTRHRNHNGYLLRWDGEGLLFDPGEGTQRQMLHAGVSAHDITRICVTHFHGDHCLGLPGVIQRINLDKVPYPVPVHYPASGEQFFERLRHASAFFETAELRPEPVSGEGGPLKATGRERTPFAVEAARLSHPVESYGYRLVEPDGQRLLPHKLRERGISGPDVGRLQREGRLGATTLGDVSETRRGQRAAFIMDTRLCEGVRALADGADLLVIEATFLDADEHLAEEHGHLTAAQAARVAAEAGVRTLVLTHFSQRYPDLEAHLTEARLHFDGEIVVAADLMRVPVPPRR
ncbi:ribonuclease Z [Streptacidiphilus neutrinimicus]|uniref:ribonuclease Z n=1 Tax=Streptacidiphilus neutrinimicus TaxID=105420 RepID=UPI0005A892BF|nr:ribonuclease Z [Streptacidiphilus neutrinimicus]